MSLLAISVIGILFSCVLYIVFGQVTVRKLRKNPATKDELGTEFISGWDIINIAQALSLPRSLTKKLDSSALSGLFAKSECLYANTTKLDQILAKLFYWSYLVSGITLMVLIFIESFIN